MRRVVGLLVAFGLAVPLTASGSGQPLRVVDSLDLSKYAGQWCKSGPLP